MAGTVSGRIFPDDGGSGAPGSSLESAIESSIVAR
jgi:hypothetical protein